MKNIWAQQKVTDKMFQVSYFATNDILLKVHINYDHDKTSWQSQKFKKMFLEWNYHLFNNCIKCDLKL